MKFRIVKTSDGRYRAEALVVKFWVFQNWKSVWNWGAGGPVLYQSLEEAERAIEQFKAGVSISNNPEQVVKYIT